MGLPEIIIILIVLALLAIPLIVVLFLVWAFTRKNKSLEIHENQVDDKHV